MNVGEKAKIWKLSSPFRRWLSHHSPGATEEKQNDSQDDLFPVDIRTVYFQKLYSGILGFIFLFVKVLE
jgi:hypothetical protein